MRTLLRPLTQASALALLWTLVPLPAGSPARADDASPPTATARAPEDRPPGDAPQDARTKELVDLVRALHADPAKGAPPFHARMTADMQAAVPVEKLREIAAGLGALRASRPRSASGPTRILACEFEGGRFDVQAAWDAAGRIAGLYYRPSPEEESGPEPAADRHAAYVPKTRLSLPFRGTWTVANGGRDPAKNHHTTNRNQRYAYDFVRAHKGEGKSLADYEAFGAEVLAPAPGTVVQVMDGAPDLPPGEADPYVIPGNMVVVDHGQREWSVLCHFQRGSIRVRVGDAVTRGQVLGLCGNSGNTSEPHIHFHLQNDPVLHRGEGLPAPFAAIIEGGQRRTLVEPSRGARVENAVEAE